MQCNVCNTKLGAPIYEANSEMAITSLCELHPGKVRVWGCYSCGHLLGEALADTRDYYESQYRILLDHEEEDQIYELQGERIIYRTEHQVTTLMNKLKLSRGARVLDYGCAKASMPRQLLLQRPDLQIHLFDVSDMYTAYWQKFLPDGRWSIHDTPEFWQGSFDVVTSFFALEHIPEPFDSVLRVASLLVEDGIFYGIVPDTFGNVADFVVMDHVNHFTNSSLYALLRKAGFKDIQIDADVHRGALVFIARKTGPVSDSPDLSASLDASRQLASYWVSIGDRIRASEAEYADISSAIYGSGFYGAYIASQLKEPERLKCFLDKSPFQQGKNIFGRKVLAPKELPDDIRLLYIGLNPTIARDTVDNLEWLSSRDLHLVFLDHDLP